jgi:UDP-N-acetylmuramoylalanine--D-glutamate ligase
MYNQSQWIRSLQTEWHNKKVAVWGAGRSGVAAASLLCKLGAQVILSDSNPQCDVGSLKETQPNLTLLLGQGNVLGEAECVILSPGIPPHHPSIQALIDHNIPFMSEIELGARCCQHPLIGITGTDGKSTTTQWIQDLLVRLGRPAKAVGNIGDPLCNHVLDDTPNLILVVEVSAFQLWSTHFFPVDVAILTNLAQDHYPYFTSETTSIDQAQSAYIASKLRLFTLASPQATLIWPDQLDVKEWIQAKTTQHNRLPFEIIQRCHTYGLDLHSDWSIHNQKYVKKMTPLFPISASPLVGRHNHRNALAVLACLTHFGYTSQEIQIHFSQFKGLPHRMEVFIHAHGQTWINDSKATNIHAACAGLDSTDQPLVVIIGGYNKELDFSPLINLLLKKARGVCCIGQTGPLLFEALEHRLEENASLKIKLSHTLNQAISDAFSLAKDGDLVILSPATSSFDQFTSFEHRGDFFKTHVLEFLKEQSSC